MRDEETGHGEGASEAFDASASPDEPMRSEPRVDQPQTPKRKGPEKYQFKPGQSGNPRGRPRRSRSLRTELTEALHEVIVIKGKHGSRKISKLGGLVHVNVGKALSGDSKGMQNVLALMRASNLLEDQSPADAQSKDLSADDAAVLADYLERHSPDRK